MSVFSVLSLSEAYFLALSVISASISAQKMLAAGDLFQHQNVSFLHQKGLDGFPRFGTKIIFFAPTWFFFCTKTIFFLHQMISVILSNSAPK